MERRGQDRDPRRTGRLTSATPPPRTRGAPNSRCPAASVGLLSMATGGGLRVAPVVDRVRPGLTGLELLPAFGPELLDVLGVGAEAEDPLVEPCLQRRSVPGHRIPLAVEPVVP